MSEANPSLLSRLERQPSFWLFQAIGWGAMFLAMVMSRVGSMPLDYLVVNKFLHAGIGFSLSMVLRSLVYKRLWASNPTMQKVGFVTVPSSFFAALIWSIAFSFTSIVWKDVYDGNPINIPGIGSMLGGTLYYSFMMLAWSMLYFGFKYYAQLLQERERSLKAEAMAQKSRLQALRYQLNPHFLFNTLNAISTLVVEEQKNEATRMIARLSDFLRLTLEEDDRQEITLAEEMEFIERYLSIEKVRFGDRLRVKKNIDPNLFDVMVPNLILQPVLENAVRYAVSPREDGATINLSASSSGGTILIEISDDGPGVEATINGQKPHGACGVGLANTRSRIEALYGDKGKVEISSGPMGCTVSIWLPVSRNPIVLDDAVGEVTPDSP